MKLKRSFYTRPTLIVARGLLGKYLVYKDKSARICEVEAYVGQDDKACHAACGKTKRNEMMFKKGGFAYIYIIYGIYHCLNITTEKEGFPSAVLIRAVEHPEANGSVSARPSLDGPGKLCRYFGLTKTQNGLDLTKGPIYIKDRAMSDIKSDRPVATKLRHRGERPKNIIATPRIGVDYAGKDAQLPWRFLIK